MKKFSKLTAGIAVIAVIAITAVSVHGQVKATYIQRGMTADYMPTADVAAGAVVVRSDLVGVANTAIASNTLGSLELGGVYDVVKAAEAITVGSPVYWDADGSNVTGTALDGAATATASGNTFMGFALETTEATDLTVRVNLRSMDSSSAGYIIATNNAERVTALEAIPIATNVVLTLESGPVVYGDVTNTLLTNVTITIQR